MLKNDVPEGPGEAVHGIYSYTGPDGVVYTVAYTADENGFVAKGDHLPTPPPIPAEIQAALDQNAAEEAAAQAYAPGEAPAQSPPGEHLALNAGTSVSSWFETWKKVISEVFCIIKAIHENKISRMT